MKKDKKTALEKNTYVDLDVTDMTPDGSGVGRTAEGAVVFVPGALAGDRASAPKSSRRRPATASDASRRCSRRRRPGRGRLSAAWPLRRLLLFRPARGRRDAL